MAFPFVVRPCASSRTLSFSPSLHSGIPLEKMNQVYPVSVQDKVTLYQQRENIKESKGEVILYKQTYHTG